MKRVAVIGAGDLGKQVLQIAKLQNEYIPVGFFDDFHSEKSFHGLDVLGKIDDVTAVYNQHTFDCLFIAIGYKHLRFKQNLMNRFSSIPFATIIHPTVFIEQDVNIESGVLIYANAYIGPGSRILKGAVINVCSYLPHDNVIKECVFLSCGINLGGKVEIGDCSFIGLGATICDNISVCEDALIGAGTVVIKDLMEPGTYVGCPARKVN